MNNKANIWSIDAIRGTVWHSYHFSELLKQL